MIPDDPPPRDDPVAYSIYPKQVDFGTPAVDKSTARLVTLTNEGTSDLLLERTSAPVGVEVRMLSPYFASPGEDLLFEVSWTPSLPLGLEGAVTLELSTETDAVAAELPLSGTGQGAFVTLSAETHDFGAVNVGCDREFTITLTNTGNQDLVTDNISIAGDASFTMRYLPMPLVLKPFESQEIDVEFDPDTRGPLAAVVQVDSDAAFAQITLDGMGLIEGEETVTYTAGEESRTTVLWHINEVVIDGPYGTHASRLADSLETFFQTLQDQRAVYRVGFIWNINGSMDGDYIDNTLTPSQAAEAAVDQYAAGGNAGDNDGSYTTLLNGIAQQSDWLFEDDQWSASKLSLIAVNRDTEASGGFYLDYVSRARAYKDDDELLVFHAIGGTPPSGCGEGTEGFQGFTVAVDETGGQFYPLCDLDWNDNMRELAAASLGGSSLFPLTGTVLVDSIELKVDGVVVTQGWTYDDDLNAITFDENEYPAKGSIIAIHYLNSSGCE